MNVLSYCQRKLIAFFTAAVQSVFEFQKKKSNSFLFFFCMLWMFVDLYVTKIMALKFHSSMNARSIQKKYQDVSHLLHRLDLKFTAKVTEIFNNQDQSASFSFSAEHDFKRDTRSCQTGAAKSGCNGILNNQKSKFKNRKKFTYLIRSLSKRLDLRNPLAKKCLINVFYFLHK